MVFRRSETSRTLLRWIFLQQRIYLTENSMLCYGPLVSDLGGPECMVPPNPASWRSSDFWRLLVILFTEFFRQLNSLQKDGYYRQNTIHVSLPLHPFKDLFSRTTWVSRYQKDKTSLDLNEATDGGVLRLQWHQLDHMQTICTSLRTDNHNSTSSLKFYRRMLFLTPNQQCQSTEGPKL